MSVERLVSGVVTINMNDSYLVLQTAEGSSAELIGALVGPSDDFLGGSRDSVGVVNHDDVEVCVGDLEYGVQHCGRHGNRGWYSQEEKGIRDGVYKSESIERIIVARILV